MEQEGIKVTRSKLTKLATDTVKSAEAMNLLYVSDTQPGIRRDKKGKGFVYTMNGKVIKDKTELERIKKLVIPPAWQAVWICKDASGHLQVTGQDVLGRKQYKYHPLWNALRNQTKFYHLYEFGKVLPAIRARLHEHLALSGLPQEKVLAAVVSVMQHTSIRIGNGMYEKLYGSFGLTTLKDKHVAFTGSSMKFSFKGKKGIYHDVSLQSRKLARIVKQCRDIPGQELFQFYTESGDRKSIDSGMVNRYIKDISGGAFTAKDFRTWAGTLYALQAFKELGLSNTITETKKNIVAALDAVAAQLGNTRTVCKKYYVHPVVIDQYTDGTLEKYLKQLEAADSGTEHIALTHDEEVMMHLLEKVGSTVVTA